MPMQKQRFPQMTEAAYAKVRDAFRRSLPGKVTTTWLMANVEGYTIEASARSLLSFLRQFGLIAEDGTTTDVARQWRTDESYGTACEIMLRNAFPADMVDAIAGGVPPSDVLHSLFMNHGVGLGSAKNLTRIFRLIASKEIPSAKTRQSNSGGVQHKAGSRRRDQPKAPRDPEGLNVAAQLGTPATPEPTITVLRYFLDRGRLAELRVPPDFDEREKRRLFAHLKIDLLDEVADN